MLFHRTLSYAVKFGVAFSLIVMMIHSCSNGGEEGPLAPFPVNEKGVHPVARLPLSTDEQVAGQLFLGTTDEPAGGFQVWRWAHDQRTMSTTTVDADGRFSFPISEFKEGQDYSFHVVDNRDRYIGPLDLTTAASGVQAAVTYQGGVGFDLGKILIPLDGSHIVDWDHLTLQANMGGGFRLNTKLAVDIDAFILPDSLQSFIAATLLVLDDTASIYSSYIQRSIHPQEYASALARDQKVALLGIQSRAEEEAGIRLASHHFLKGARLAQEVSDSNQTAQLWDQTGFRFVLQGKGFHRANFIPNQLLDHRDIFLSAFDHKTKGMFFIPRRPTYFITMLPEVKSIGTTGSTTDIRGTAKGLLSPVCLETGDVLLNALPPLISGETAAAVATLDAVEIRIEYYDQNLALMTAQKTDFPIKYRGDISLKTDAGLTRTWKPSEQKLRFSLTEKSRTTNGGDVLAIPAETFLDKIGDSAVLSYKVLIVYRGSLYQAGTALLVKKCS